MFFDLRIWILLDFSGKKCSQRQHNAFSVCLVRRPSSAPDCLNFEFKQEKGQLECHPLTCSFSLWSFNFPCSNCPEASWHQGVLWNILAFHEKKTSVWHMRLWSSDANALVQIQIVMNKIFGSYLNTEHSEKPSSSNNNQASYQEGEVGLYRRFLKCIRQSLISALVLCCTCKVDYLSYNFVNSVHTFRNYQNTVLSRVPGSLSKAFRGWMLQQWLGRTGARTDLEGLPDRPSGLSDSGSLWV